MGAHINKDGLFQSDKYPECPAGKVPLSINDKTAQDLLWEYAQRRLSVDAEFSADLKLCLKAAGYASSSTSDWGVWNTAQSCWVSDDDGHFGTWTWVSFGSQEAAVRYIGDRAHLVPKVRT